MRLAALLCGYVALSTSGLLLLRYAMDSKRSPEEGVVASVLSLSAVAGGALYVASFAVWLVALQRYPVTTVYPVFVGAGIVGVAVAGSLILGEPFGTAHAVGTIVVLAGVVLLTH